MPATVIISPDDNHLYVFMAAHITRIWTSGGAVNIALTDGHPHHKLRFADCAARDLVRDLGQAIAYYDREPRVFTIEVDQDGNLRVSTTAPPRVENEQSPA